MNKLVKSCAIAFVSLSACTGLVSCDKNQLVEPLVPAANPTDSEIASINALGRKQYRLMKINKVHSNGNTNETIFQYSREGKLTRVTLSGKRFDFVYGNNTITSTVFVADTAGVVRKQTEWIYKLNASGRCYQALVSYFDKDGLSYGQKELDYYYTGTGKLEKIKHGADIEASFIYNNNGDLFKSLNMSNFEQLYYYDKPGLYAANLLSTKPGELPLQGLIPDKSDLNPWNLPYVNEFLPIFGRFRTHLPKRYQQHHIDTNTTNADWSTGYSLNEDNQVIERSIIVSAGYGWKDSYNYNVIQIEPNQQ
ncbi:hypothetical protein GCM10028805_24250 [Spirosoma harenae]